MIDIHSHILPEVDDGSKNAEQSFEMLNDAVNQGITDIILTPHYRVDYLNDGEKIRKKFADFKASVAERGINVSLYLGQEIFVFYDMAESLKSGKLLSLNDSKYVLVEFSPEYSMDIPETVYMIKTNGFIPIVAHLCRYHYADIETAREIKELGGLIQLNAGAFCDTWKRRRKAFGYIKEGLVDFIASDVHFGRDNNMEKAYRIVSKKFGTAVADKLFTENAERILNKQK
ncbi:MAG: hypothetical protein J5911_04605 [Clostridia bacterium]|nr:hypothetical protein [Clostridia bacterium]